MHLFHTSDTHPARFDRLRDRIAPGAGLVHHVHEDWLDRARTEGLTGGLVAEIGAAISAEAGPKLCTCTTIGHIAEAAGATRIDRPLMEAAARIGGHVLLVYCLESTAEGSHQLLRDCIDGAGGSATVERLALTRLWPIFESGDLAGFAAAIAAAVEARLRALPRPDCIVLAQASMADAADSLGGYGVPVLTGPELAFRTALIGGAPMGGR